MRISPDVRWLFINLCVGRTKQCIRIVPTESDFSSFLFSSSVDLV